MGYEANLADNGSMGYPVQLLGLLGSREIDVLCPELYDFYHTMIII